MKTLYDLKKFTFMKILITGGCGFIGSNAALSFAQEGHEVVLLDNMSRRGSAENRAWLLSEGIDHLHEIDIRDAASMATVIASEKPDVVLHLAAQVAVTTSVDDPREDFEVNALGTFNLLEAIRESCPEAIVIYASTNKVYGDLDGLEVEDCGESYLLAGGKGVTEQQLLDFHSPYGCSKGAADQYVVDYSRIYGLRSVSLRQSCIYGPRQFGVEDQGWVAWFCIAAELGKSVTVYGNGKQSRDLLHVDDLVDAYRSIVSHADNVAGEAFNVGGGNERVLSVNQLVNILGNDLHDVSYAEERPGDQKVFVSDNSKMKLATGWTPNIRVDAGVASLREWIAAKRDMLIRYLS